VVVASGGPDQVAMREGVQHPAGLRDAVAGEGRHGGRAEFAGRMKAEQPERARSGTIQLPAGPGQHRPDGGPAVTARVETVQPRPRVGELAHQPGQRCPGAGGGQLGRDPEREWQPRALRGQLQDGPGVRLRARADQRAQQRRRVGRGQHVQLQPLSAVPCHQTGKGIAAGHNRGAARRAGQHRPHLLCRAGVVEQHQRPPSAEQAPVQGRAFRRLGRQVPARPAQSPDEPSQRFGHRQRLGGVVAAQIHVDLAVRKPVRDLVRPRNDRGGLAHTRRSGHRADCRGPPTWFACAARQGVQFARPANEVRHQRRELARHGSDGGERGPAMYRCRRRGQRRVGGEDLLLQQPQVGPGLDPELAQQGPPDALKRGERLGLPAVTIQRDHELRVQPFPERMHCGQSP